MESNDLIALYQARDEAAVRLTAERCGAACQRLAERILGSREDAEECVSDALLQVWNAIPPAEPEHFEAFLLTAVRRNALSRYRQQHAAKRGGGAAASALDELDEMLAGTENVEKIVEMRALTEAVNRFLAAQPKQNRVIFVRHFWLLDSAGEIADALHMNRNSVKTVLRRTTEKLRGFLREEGFL